MATALEDGDGNFIHTYSVVNHASCGWLSQGWLRSSPFSVKRLDFGGKGNFETSAPTIIRVLAYGKHLSFRSCVGISMALCEMTVVSLFQEEENIKGRPSHRQGLSSVSCYSCYPPSHYPQTLTALHTLSNRDAPLLQLCTFLTP